MSKARREPASPGGDEQVSEHDSAADQLRLSVVAALVAGDASPGQPGTGPQGPVSGGPAPASQRPADSATSDERPLAEALRGPAGEPADEAARAIAELLRLADGTAAAGTLAVGLRQVFLIPDDSRHAQAREEREAAFADVYRRLALPELAGAARGRAQAILGSLTSD